MGSHVKSHCLNNMNRTLLVNDFLNLEGFWVFLDKIITFFILHFLCEHVMSYSGI